jgi:multicomponent Na+:H+ antiporter subunit D
VSALLTLPVAVPLLAAALTVLAHNRTVLQRVISFAGASAVFGIAITLVIVTAVQTPGETPATQVGGWPPGFAIPFVADAFAALMLSVAALIVIAGTAFAAAREEDAHPAFHPLVMVMSAGVFGAFLTADLFNLFVFFEVMLIASYVLLSLRGDRRQVHAGAIYVPTNLLASTVLLSGVALLYGVTGTVNLGQLHDLALQSDAVALAAAVIVVAVAVKASVVPLHSWLPRSYPEASPAVSALFSGLLTKAGVYVLYRLDSVVFAGAPGYRTLILSVAALTMVIGVLGAVGRGDLRGILSFHMVSQVGYLILPLGFFGVAGLAAGIFYLLQYIVVKASLFLSAGAVETETGTGSLSRLGGMAPRRPVLAFAFLMAAFALAGIPPLSGFVGKYLLIRAAFEAGAYAAGGVAVAVSLFTLLSMVKIWNGAFWGQPPAEPRAREPVMGLAVPAGGAGTDAPGPPVTPVTPTLSRGRAAALVTPALALALLTAVFGFGAEGLLQVSTRAAEGLVDPSAYLEAVRTP